MDNINSITKLEPQIARCLDCPYFLTKGQAYSLAEFIDLNLIDTIRNDTEIDSTLWLRNIIHAFEKLCAVSGYDSGYADEEKDNEDA